MKKIMIKVVLSLTSILLVLILFLSSASKVMNIVDSIGSTLKSWFASEEVDWDYDEADYNQWLNSDAVYLEQLYDSKYVNFNLAEAISLAYRLKYHETIIQDISDWKEYLEIFTEVDKNSCLSKAQLKYKFDLGDDSAPKILQLATIIGNGSNLLRMSSSLGLGDIGFYAEENTIIPAGSVSADQFWSLVEYVCDANNCLSAQAKTRQCTAFVFYRFNTTYHLTYINGDGCEVAEWIVNHYPSQFYLSQMPAAGAVFSVPASDRYSIHGHTGFIEKVAEEDGVVYVWFSDGNCPNGYARLNIKVSLTTFFNQFGEDVVFAVPVSN